MPQSRSRRNRRPQGPRTNGVHVVGNDAPVQSDQPVDERYAPTAWSPGGTGATELTCPSGQLCLARRPGMQGLIKAGILHNMDTLSKLVDTEVTRASGKRPTRELTIADVTSDPAMVDDALHMMWRIVSYVVIAPKIEMPLNDPTNRKPGVIYADDVDMIDLNFIVNFALGGTRDLESFRAQYEDAVRSLEPEQDAPNAS